MNDELEERLKSLQDQIDRFSKKNIGLVALAKALTKIGFYALVGFVVWVVLAR